MVKFLAKGQGCDLFFTADETVMRFIKPNRLLKKDRYASIAKTGSGMLENLKVSVLKMKFVGANRNAKISPYGQLEGKRNYLSASGSITNVPTYSNIVYNDLYKGIGVKFYSRDQFLEYDFVVAPNTDVSAIRIKFEGAESVKIASNGDLILRLGDEEILNRKPEIYQEVGGTRKKIEGEYVIKNNGEVGFNVGQYDRNKPLVIDPILTFSTYIGGGGTDYGLSIDVDTNGNAFVTGYTNSSNFPITTGTSTSGGYQIFVTKFNAAGQAVFSTYWGGSGDDLGRSIKVDSTGNSYVTGSTNSSSYPTTQNAYQSSKSGGVDAVATKLNPTGTGFVYSTFLGGGDDDVGRAVVVDETGNAYLGGETWSTNFPTTSGVFQPSMTNSRRGGYITKLNATGTALSYTTYLYGNDTTNPLLAHTIVRGLAIDTNGNVYATGTTTSSNFPVTAGAYQATRGGNDEAFISKLNNNATALTNSTYLGGSLIENAWNIDLDSSGNVYVIGETWGGSFPVTSGAVQTTPGGETDLFVTKLNPALSAVSYSTFLGGSDFEEGYGIRVSSAGEAFISGMSESGNFPVTTDAFQSLRNGEADTVIAKLNSTGSSLIYSTYFGGSGGDYGSQIDITSCGDVYFTGGVRSTDFPVRQPYQSTNRTTTGIYEGFVTKLTFLSTIERAPDASADGPLATKVTEYKLPPSVDTDVLDLHHNGTALQVELWASVYRPLMLSSTQYPLLVFLHGMHNTCKRNATPDPTPDPPPAPPPPVLAPGENNLYAYTGSCDNPNTTFDETPYYDVIKNHRGYDYLGQKLASQGYIVVSINANLGIHDNNSDEKKTGALGDPYLILPRAKLVLRHLQKLKEWNDCTTNPDCQTPSSVEADLRGKLDFGNVGFLGHSRGGQAVRAAYNLSPGWIPNLNIKGIFEVGPTDEYTDVLGIWLDPSTKFTADKTSWNVLLPMCDSDVFDLRGVRVFDRMLLDSADTTTNKKSTYTVWGANHNFYNTEWDYHDLKLGQLFGYTCVDNDPLFNPTDTGSAKQRETAISSVTAFFKSIIGSSPDPNYSKNFNPSYELPANVQAITRIERGYAPTTNSSFTKVFDDFPITSTNTYEIGTPANVQVATDTIMQHDPTLNVAVITWTASGTGKYFQTNWTSAGTGVDISAYQTLDFRISRVRDVSLNSAGTTNLSIQLIMADNSLSSSVKLCKYVYLDGPVGGWDISSSGQVFENWRPILQTVRIPLADFTGVTLSQIRGIRFIFDETQTGKINVANIRLNK